MDWLKYDALMHLSEILNCLDYNPDFLTFENGKNKLVEVGAVWIYYIS